MWDLSVATWSVTWNLALTGRRIVNFKPLVRARAANIRVGMICSASVSGVEVVSRR